MNLLEWSEAFSNFTVVVAAVAAGVWFFFRRSTVPRAELVISATCIIVPERGVVIHSSTTLKNIGDIKIEITNMLIRYQVMEPVDFALLDRVSRKKNAKGESAQAEWPDYKERTEEREQGRGVCIEPGEIDSFYSDVLFPIDTKRVRIYAHYTNPSNTRIGWDTELIVLINSECRQAESVSQERVQNQHSPAHQNDHSVQLNAESVGSAKSEQFENTEVQA